MKGGQEASFIIWWPCQLSELFCEYVIMMVRLWQHKSIFYDMHAWKWGDIKLSNQYPKHPKSLKKILLHYYNYKEKNNHNKFSKVW